MLELILDLLDRAARGFLFALPAAIFWFAALCFRKRGRMWSCPVTLGGGMTIE